DELVPIENAAMADRTVIEWDKDDIDAMGMLKVDCLGLGMLTCVRKALDMVLEREQGHSQMTPCNGTEPKGMNAEVAEGTEERGEGVGVEKTGWRGVHSS